MKRELGTLERAMLIADQHAPFQITGVLRMEDAPPPHVLKQALRILQRRHPFLRALLFRERGKYSFADIADPEFPFYVLPRWNAGHWIAIAEVELARRVDAARGPMFRCTYLYNATDQRGDIILTCFQAIMDGSSLSRLMHDLLSICASILEQKTVSVYELAPAPPAESRFPSAYRGFLLTLHKMRYALKQSWDELLYNFQTRNKRVPAVHRDSSQGHILSVQLPADLTETLLRRAHKEGMTLNSLLNAAMLLAVNRHLYAGQQVPMRTLSFASLRPYVEPPLGDEDLAFYVSMLQHTLTVSGGADFWSLARRLHSRINSSLKSGDKFAAAALAEPFLARLTALKVSRMATTGLNYSGMVPVQSVYGSIRVMGLHSFVSAFDLGPELMGEAQIFNTHLFWDFVYLEEDMSREEAEAIVEEIKSILHFALWGEAKTRPISL